MIAKKDVPPNTLYYGDNLEILRRYVKDESVDLIYLDPPFNSNQDYNVLFKERGGDKASSQVRAFEDTWRWDTATERTYEETVEGGGRVAEALIAFRTFIGRNDMLAYLTMMAPRLVELRRVLKETGSIYLHCDPTASHYLKLLMDAVFGATNFRNEIVWKRSQPKSHAKLRFSRAHDVILSYAKSEESPFRSQYVAHDPEYVKKFYRYVDPKTGRHYRLGDLTNPNPNRPNLTYEFPPGSGIVRVWRWTRARMMKAWKDGIVVVPEDGGIPCLKRYLDEQPGTPVTDVWNDVEHLHGSHHERLGYPTQKPEALLERIIQASSDEKNVVLDPFCGCGTAIAVAQRLKRRWIGIDITPIAITLVKTRLHDAFGKKVRYNLIGEPVSFPDARALAEQDPFHFQYWALGLVGARPADEKRGRDQGIDGQLYFHDEAQSGRTKQILFSVKAGNTTVAHVRDLRGTVEREEAEIGVLILLNQPTRAMRSEAAAAGFYESPWTQRKHPRIQILTIEDLLAGKEVDYPPSRQTNVTFKKAPKALRDEGPGPQMEIEVPENDDD